MPHSNRTHKPHCPGEIVRSELLIRRPWHIVTESTVCTLLRLPSVPLTPREVADKYRGFDCEVWPFREEFEKEGIVIEEMTGLVRLQYLRQLQDIQKRLPDCDLLFLTYELDHTFFGTEWDGDFVFLGFDYGNYISEHNYYSVLLHEIVNGKYKELRRHALQLNDNLLFSGLDFLSELRHDRHCLVQKGADLEVEYANESYEPIKIYGLKK